MKQIVGLFQNKHQAKRVLEALDELGIDEESLSTYSRSHVEVEKIEGEAPGEIMVTAYVKPERLDQAKTIFKNSEAIQVNVWGDDWKPQTTWSPIVYERITN